MKNPLDRIEDTFEINLPVPQEESLEGYLEVALRDLSKLGEDLHETEFYVSPGGKPWLEISDDPNVQEAVLHFFNEGGEYLLSVEGNVTKGKWRLLDGTEKLIIERGPHHVELFEKVFLNRYFFVLRKHGNFRRKGRYLFLGYEPYVTGLTWKQAVDLMYDEYRKQFSWFHITVALVIVLAVFFAVFSGC